MGKRHQIPSLGLASRTDIETALARRLFADDDGTLVDANGADMVEHAENALISQITNDPRRREALRRKLVLITAEQAGPNPTAIERLLARRVALCWLDTYYMDILKMRYAMPAHAHQAAQEGPHPTLVSPRAN
jgi:hypothetical protein